MELNGIQHPQGGLHSRLIYTNGRLLMQVMEEWLHHQFTLRRPSISSMPLWRRHPWPDIFESRRPLQIPGRQLGGFDQLRYIGENVGGNVLLQIAVQVELCGGPSTDSAQLKRLSSLRACRSTTLIEGETQDNVEWGRTVVQSYGPV